MKSKVQIINGFKCMIILKDNDKVNLRKEWLSGDYHVLVENSTVMLTRYFINNDEINYIERYCRDMIRWG